MTNIAKGIKVARENSNDVYAVRYSSVVDAEKETYKYVTLAFTKIDGKFVTDKSVEDNSGEGESFALVGDTLILYTFVKTEDNTSFLKADFLNTSAKKLQFNTKIADLKDQLTSYGLTKIEGISAYNNGSGVLIQSNSLILEAKITNPKTNPTDLKVTDVRVYPIQTKRIALCPCPGWIYQFDTEDGFKPRFTQAHRNSGSIFMFKQFEGETVVDVACDGFSGFINVTTQSNAEGNARTNYMIKRGVDTENRLQSMVRNYDKNVSSRTTPAKLYNVDSGILDNELYLSFAMVNGMATAFLNTASNTPLI